MILIKENSELKISKNYFNKKIKMFFMQILPSSIKKRILKYLYNNKITKSNNLSIKEVFTNVYQNNSWGGKKGEYFSGFGSIDPSTVEYSKIIKNFIIENKINKIVDLGCGDFRVGKQLILAGVNYIGTDIVKPLIDYNKSMYNRENISFMCLDIIKDDLPDGQLCLIRQVLQHLSNQEILQILEKIKKYQYVIVTEHMPDPRRKIIPNKDKQHGLDIRIIYDSAVYLDQHPFNVKISKILLDTRIKDYCLQNGERLRTFLIVNK